MNGGSLDAALIDGLFLSGDAMREALRDKIPAAYDNISILNIGTIVASHCGPGTVAVFFYGSERGE